MRILVLERDPIAAQSIEANLRGLQHDPTILNRLSDAWSRLEAEPFDVVICGSTEAGNYPLSQSLRNQSTNSSVYVVRLIDDTEWSRLSEVDRLADAFLSRSFDSVAIEQCLRNVGSTQTNCELHAREMMIFGLAKLVEARDPNAQEHLERIREYACVLTRQLQQMGAHADIIDEEYIRLIYLTSPLHDIGKVAIPDGVLLKPGRFTEKEFEIVKRHSTLGAETIDRLMGETGPSDYLHMARDIAGTHHEKFDGSGYPSGLKGAEIPLSGRIVALADVYDALTTKRVYKTPSTHDVARSLIVQSSGLHFDPEVVQAFVDTESEFVRIKKEFSRMDATTDDLLDAEILITH